MTTLYSKRRASHLQSENSLRDIVIVIAVNAGLILVLLRERILPDRFLGDETTIQQLAQQLWETPGDPSYDRVADIYRFLMLADYPLAAGLLGFLVSLVPYAIALHKYRSQITMAPLVLVATGIILSSVYMGTYSKEMFVVPVIVLVLLLDGRRRNLLVVSGAMCLYAMFFREYWYMSAILFMVISLLPSRFVAAPVSMLVSLASVFLGSILFSIVFSIPADHYRTAVNLYRVSYGDVNSLIQRYVQVPEPMGGAVNNALSFVFLQFPFPLALKFSAYYLALFLFFCLLWVSFYLKTRSSVLQAMSRLDSDYVQRVAALILSFAITQSFFEPDYGSALKHLTPLMPLFLVPWMISDPSDSKGFPTDKERSS